MTDTESRHALVIAGSRYDDPRLCELRSPSVDATRLATVLANPGVGNFTVETAIDETDGQLRRRIAAFFSDRRTTDLLLVHASCHGVQDANGELHLATVNTETGNLLGATSVAASWLAQQMERSYSKQIVLLLDCCFSGAFPFGFRARAGQDIPVAHSLGGRGRVVITASSAMEYAWDGDGLSGEPQPSIFTGALLEGLETGAAGRDGESWVTVSELYDYVFDAVRRRTPHQRPQMMSDVEGALAIARNVRTTADGGLRAPRPRPATAVPPRPRPRPAPAGARRPEPPPTPPVAERQQPIAPRHEAPLRGDRVVAGLIDAPFVILFGALPALIVAIPLALLSTADQASTVGFLTALVLGGAIYPGLLGAFGRDRTIGQQARSLRVLAAHRDEHADLWRRVLREALKWSSLLLLLLLLSLAGLLLFALVFPRVRRFVTQRPSERYYDRLAGTRLVHETAA